MLYLGYYTKYLVSYTNYDIIPNVLSKCYRIQVWYYIHIMYTDSSSYYLCSRNCVRVPVTVSCGHVLLFYTLYQAERTATSPEYQSGGGTLCYTGHDTLSTTLHCHVGCFVEALSHRLHVLYGSLKLVKRIKERSTFTCYIAYIESYNLNSVTS